MKGVNQKEFWILFYVLLRFAIAVLLIMVGRSSKRVGKLIQSEVVIAPAIRKKYHEAKILFKNQRPSAEGGPGPFEGPSSYPQLEWSLMLIYETQAVISLSLTFYNCLS